MKKKIVLLLLVVVFALSVVLSCVSCDKEEESALIKEKKNILNYISSVSGNHIISGQQESTWTEGGEDYEFNYIEQNTGKLPAIRGLDYMGDDFEGVNARAIKWANKGGIVTICWHAGKYFEGNYQDARTNTNGDYDEARDNNPVANWDEYLTEGTEEYNKMIAGMDKGAQALKKLKDAGVVVLWRPFHELNGDWFWWSLGGAENFKKLWQIMYDRYTNVYGLDNLIWVLGYSHLSISDYARGGKEIIYYPEEDWYPGDKYVDIAGADSYSGNAEKDRYDTLKKAIPNKPLCFHECGTIPTVKMFKETPWVFFMTWHTEWLVYNDGNSQNDNTIDSLNEIYNDDYVITLDELPSFRE